MLPESLLSLGLLFRCVWCVMVFKQRFPCRCSAPCCVSMWRRKSTFRWKARRHLWHWNGLKPVCFRLWVIKFDDWEKALPQTIHLWGFSPKEENFPSYFDYFNCLRLTTAGQWHDKSYLRMRAWSSRETRTKVNWIYPKEKIESVREEKRKIMTSTGVKVTPETCAASIFPVCIFNRTCLKWLSSYFLKRDALTSG